MTGDTYQMWFCNYFWNGCYWTSLIIVPLVIVLHRHTFFTAWNDIVEQVTHYTECFWHRNKILLIVSSFSVNHGLLRRQQVYEYWAVLVHRRMDTTILAEAAFWHGVGNLEASLPKSMNQIHTASINTEEAWSGRVVGSRGSHFDDLIQLLGTPIFPPTTQR